MKRKALQIMGSAALTIALMGGCGSQPVVEDTVDYVSEKINKISGDIFREDIAGSVGDHIVYSYNLFENRNYSDKQRKDMLAYLEQVDSTLTEDIYITGFTEMSVDGSYKFYARQCGNGAVVSDVYYWTDVDDPDPNIVIVEGSPVTVPDTSGVIPAKELFEKVENLAEANSSKLNDYDSKGIYGEYLLTYDIARDLLVYDFEVNDYSNVILNAKTGELVEERYDDGVIMD